MALPGKIAALGDIMQLAYVPEDFDAAVKHWTQTMGVGPFYIIEGIHLDGMKYRGEPTDAVFDLALAYWGDLQIELIRPRDNHPSVYTGEYGATGNGLHHVCILVDDIAEARRELGDQRVLVGRLVQLVHGEALGEQLLAALEQLVGLQDLDAHGCSSVFFFCAGYHPARVRHATQTMCQSYPLDVARQMCSNGNAVEKPKASSRG